MGYVISVLMIGVAVFLDQYTKKLAATHIKDTPISIVDGVFELQYLENRGAAFGMLQNKQWFFLIISVVLLVVAVFVFIKLPHVKRMIPLRLCMIFITSGAIGNMIDRVRLNYVVDFLYFKLINFPIFNVADIYVSVSTFILAALLLFYYKDDEVDSFFQTLSFKKKESRSYHDA